MFKQTTTFLLLTLLTLLPFCHAGPDWWAMWQHRNTCMAKDATVLSAIYTFCARDFYTGSSYAGTGATVGRARVAVGASCKWGTFVPKEWCESQMLEVCAFGNKKGRGQRKYDNGCQHFWIS